MSNSEHLQNAADEADQQELSDEQLNTVAGGDPTSILAESLPKLDLSSSGDQPDIFTNAT